LPTVWRIVKTKYAASAFDGEGAKLAGGRWTSVGRKAVYASSTVALATLEMVAHLDSTKPLAAYSLIRVEIPDSLVASVDLKDLPPNWTEYPPPPQLAAIGDGWLNAKTHAVLKVPTALGAAEIPEFNYVLNPEHPEFPRIRFGDPIPFHLHHRLS